MIARTPETFRDRQNIDARTLHEVEAIDMERRRVRVRQLESAGVQWEAFDQLLIATGDNDRLAGDAKRGPPGLVAMPREATMPAARGTRPQAGTFPNDGRLPQR